jgi:hypothetical protein
VTCDCRRAVRVRTAVRPGVLLVSLVIAAGACSSPAARATQRLPPGAVVALDGCSITMRLGGRAPMRCSDSECVVDVTVIAENDCDSTWTVTKVGAVADGLPRAVLPHTTTSFTESSTFDASVTWLGGGIEVRATRADGEITGTTLYPGFDDPRERQLAAAQARCAACDGDWGQHHRMGPESCLCRAADRGKACIDSDECVGACVIERFVVHDPALDIGHAEGRCSEFAEKAACVPAIPSGARRDIPYARGTMTKVCAD